MKAHVADLTLKGSQGSVRQINRMSALSTVDGRMIANPVDEG